MLKDLILRQLALDEPGDAELEQLPPKRPAVVAFGEEAVVHHLHRDRAESLAHTEGANVANESAHEATPVQSIVIVEAPVLRGDERLLHVHRHFAQLDVYAAHDGEASDETAVLVDDPPTLAWMEGADLGRTRAAREATSEEPGVGSEHSDRRAGKQ